MLRNGLDHAAFLLMIFNFHVGCFRYIRIPFILQISQDVHQMHMDQILDRFPGMIELIVLCVYMQKSNEERHCNLLKLMGVIKENGFIFNNTKHAKKY